MTVAGITLAVVAIGGAIAYGLNTSGPGAHAAASADTPQASTFGAEGTLVPPANVKLPARRHLDHAHPLKLWIGGDSLAGSFGPALGDRVGATGVVSTVIDYKTSSGLSSNDIRNWNQRASEQMASVNPEAVVFIIGTNDASIVNNVNANGGLEPDWETSYRLKIDRMMDLLVGPSHRTVLWLGPPTLGSSDLDRGGKAIGELMRQEALKRSADVVYLDTYKLFSTISGNYSSTILDENGKSIVARISDGVHFSADGADYLARAVFSLIDGRWNLTKQADPAQPIGWTNAPGSGEVVPGYSSTPRSRYQYQPGNSSGNSNTTQAPVSATTASPGTSAPPSVTPTTSAPKTTVTVAPPTTPKTTPKTVTTTKPLP